MQSDHGCMRHEQKLKNLVQIRSPSRTATRMQIMMFVLDWLIDSSLHQSYCNVRMNRITWCGITSNDIIHNITAGDITSYSIFNTSIPHYNTYLTSRPHLFRIRFPTISTQIHTVTQLVRDGCWEASIIGAGCECCSSGDCSGECDGRESEFHFDLLMFF